MIESMLKPTRDIASQVYELLPNSIPDRDGAMFDEHSHTEASGNPEYIARHIDGNVEDVRTALKELQNELHNVHSINGVYYRS
ncbi:hypothetical protein C497_05702 [Halalkalicoccus jeotgali B3]|uniref:Uncharacterized protein n=1 Tax=Halalkalicoccus jeotgali (strain DSM 18796 / CECT 7217 / JCM 14584 / KCTC 4019 / B3) TaxID=795797 RepID=D8JAX1_HALJB|nr:hypothetical protein HacjB3_07290 [Halalkalicoccus jeotgali B3]ELY39426.1 hypothetical protein C497_05702 [Halalkalicoccus jeotgali B3]